MAHSELGRRCRLVLQSWGMRGGRPCRLPVPDHRVHLHRLGECNEQHWAGTRVEPYGVSPRRLGWPRPGAHGPGWPLRLAGIEVPSAVTFCRGGGILVRGSRRRATWCSPHTSPLTRPPCPSATTALCPNRELRSPDRWLRGRHRRPRRQRLGPRGPDKGRANRVGHHRRRHPPRAGVAESLTSRPNSAINDQHTMRETASIFAEDIKTAWVWRPWG